jgi:tryptophan-rich sensory protein
MQINLLLITIRVLCAIVMLACGFVTITGVAYWFSGNKRPLLEPSDVVWPLVALALTLGAAFVTWGHWQ